MTTLALHFMLTLLFFFLQPIQAKMFGRHHKYYAEIFAFGVVTIGSVHLVYSKIMNQRKKNSTMTEEEKEKAAKEANFWKEHYRKRKERQILRRGEKREKLDPRGWGTILAP